MNACIITIGNEILDGTRLDTNSQWISKRIAQHGVCTRKMLSVGDSYVDICDAIKSTIDKYDFIFITGGLGPTHDDITLSAFQKIFNLESKIDLEYLEKLNQLFLNRNIKMPVINQNQALILNDTNVLNNSMGTARGLHYKHLNSDFFIMPGVPSEMYKMMDDVVAPSYLGSKIKAKSIIIRTSGIAESKLAEKLHNLMSRYNKDCSFSFLPSYRGVDFVLKLKNDNCDISLVSDAFYKNMEPYAFGYNQDSFAEFILNELKSKNISISFAESCTGGFLSKIFTDISGSSSVFKGAVIAYNDSIKKYQLNISEKKLKKFGAVSSEVAQDMALSIKDLFKSDLGLAITGISGPGGGSNLKSVGLVYISIYYKNKHTTKKFNFNLNRDMNRKFTCYTALNMIRKVIND